MKDVIIMVLDKLCNKNFWLFIAKTAKQLKLVGNDEGQLLTRKISTNSFESL